MLIEQRNLILQQADNENTGEHAGNVGTELCTVGLMLIVIESWKDCKLIWLACNKTFVLILLGKLAKNWGRGGTKRHRWRLKAFKWRFSLVQLIHESELASEWCQSTRAGWPRSSRATVLPVCQLLDHLCPVAFPPANRLNTQDRGSQ